MLQLLTLSALFARGNQDIIFTTPSILTDTRAVSECGERVQENGIFMEMTEGRMSTGATVDTNEASVHRSLKELSPFST